MTTRLLTVLVLSLVVFAGCVGGDPAADGGTETTDGGAVPADQSDLSVEAADRLLRDAGSFTATWSYSTTEAGETATITNAYQVDLRANRSIETFSMSGPDAGTEFETFVADGSAYTRYETDDEAFYQVRPQDDTAFQSAVDRGTLSYESVDDARLIGAETFDGVTVDRYEYSDLSTWQQFGAGAFGSGGNVTVTDFTVVILIDESGLARQTAWTLTGETDDGETVSVEWRYEITGVGSTEVPDPDWLDEARQQSDGAT
ncbi:hypothetical protein NDI54_03985 [Haloarcula sp. S1AR25-5A]|uniref:Lipoprotein n=1 Tax=Haloarcula terrestris TaxID=2950533 RepID=A0AAE4EUT4_9EURY|nr:hypothetical protein [Haloarcula terrestris]MDS0220508.1 hypothetical protein [Haloarcula terrestris]